MRPDEVLFWFFQAVDGEAKEILDFLEQFFFSCVFFKKPPNRKKNTEQKKKN